MLAGRFARTTRCTLTIQARAFGTKGPTKADVEQLSKKWNLGVEARELDEYEGILGAFSDSFRRCEELFNALPPTPVPKRNSWVPKPEDNKHNAWYARCDISEKSEGKLAGKTVGIKDTVCVAGVPMMNGSAVLEGFVPATDATVIRRILDEGGRIIGKTHCEDLCFSGSSFTNATGSIRNAHNPKYAAGGSSSGSAVVVATKEADLAIAGDQGGSIRIPACRNGVVGLKPTHGLVPYTGVFAMERTVDHVGPHARTVANAARLLEVIAGKDGLDGRQLNAPAHASEATRYSARLDPRVVGKHGRLRIGVIREGFGTDALVDASVRAALDRLVQAGASVVDVSLPLHKEAGHIWTAICTQGIFTTQYIGAGMGDNSRQPAMPELATAFAEGMRERAHRLSHINKLFCILGQHTVDNYGAQVYATGRVLADRLTAEFDNALNTADNGNPVHVLAMPTLPTQAELLPENPSACSASECVGLALGMIANTVANNVTGHPAITMPTEPVNGLPVGIMFVGRRWEDQRVLDVAGAYEAIKA